MAARTHFSARTHNEPQNLVEYALEFFFQCAFFILRHNFQICHNIRNFVSMIVYTYLKIINLATNYFMRQVTIAIFGQLFSEKL